VHERKNAGLVDFSSYQRREAGQIFSSMGNYDFSPALNLLPKKNLLLLGESDFLTGPAADYLKSRASETYTFEKTGHSPFVECPAAFFDKILAFLS
jgi:pimeloyl-ACP methyl ester carboxylesterase